MDKSYLIQFNTDGTRLNTYANTVHYLVTEAEEKEAIINLDDFDYQDVLNNGGVWFNEDDYNKLVGNTGKKYIYKDGKIVEKPAYVPTAEEIQEQERAKLDAEYAELFTDKDSEIINAAILMQDDEYAEKLRQERTALTQEYLTKRGAL